MIKTIAEHRSIRKFKEQAIPRHVMEEILTAATRASTTGNMQLYSIVVSESQELKKALSPLHFNQPSVTQAAAVVTFCADVNRFSKWCDQRDAEPAYHNFMWWVNAAIDALLASENFALEAQNQGLGICYLGTTIYNGRQICDTLELPHGVVPVTTIVVGYPDSTPELTGRLPLEGVVHYERYTDYTPQAIDKIYAETENSEQTKRLLAENDLPNLAQIFTQRRYKKADSLHFSKEYFELISQQGFFNDDNWATRLLEDDK